MLRQNTAGTEGRDRGADPLARVEAGDGRLNQVRDGSELPRESPPETMSDGRTVVCALPFYSRRLVMEDREYREASRVVPEQPVARIHTSYQS